MREMLLAKSDFQGRSKTLLSHTQDVVLAASALFGVEGQSTRLGERFVRLFRVHDFDRFARNLTCSAALHDVGKANEEFQLAIDASNNGGRRDQAVRHEHVSSILFAGESGNPLREAAGIDWQLVVAAVAGHHRKTLFESKLHRSLVLNSDTPAFHELMQQIESWTGIRFPPESFMRTLSPDQASNFFNDDVVCVLNDVCDVCESDSEMRRMHYALNSALIIADTVASALVRGEDGIVSWVQRTFSPVQVLDADRIKEAIIDKRIAELNQQAADAERPPFEWSCFQLAAEALPARGLLLAPCGSGKTLAAWKWLASQATGGIRHVIFLYPTRATATEGFRDYVSWAPESEASLLHGTAAYELEGMFENPGAGDDRRVGQQYVPENSASLRSIAYWDRHYFSATVDQFLSFVQWNYASICMLPVLADAAIVIDEVHSFDDAMFSSLESLLDRLDMPVLCMTATLTNERQESLKRLGLECLDAYQTDFPDLRQIDSAGRYSVRRCSTEQVLESIGQSIKLRYKILCVVNTVERAQNLYEEIVQSGVKANLFCYHSRFTLEHRQKHHENVVRHFKSSASDPCIAITTQVCEMGLDLDADILITEDCPPSSLVQRMGRVNRARKPRPEAGTVLVYKPDSNAPYERDELRACAMLVAELSEKERTSQAEVNEALARTSARNSTPQSLASFFRGGTVTVGDYRDIQAYTKPAILDDDVADCVQLRKSRKAIDGFIVPVPRQTPSEPAPTPLPRWLSVVSKSGYSPDIGFHGRGQQESDTDDALSLGAAAWII